MSNKTKIHKIYSLIIKIGIIVYALWFIYRRIFIKENFDDLIYEFSYIFLQKNFLPVLLLVIILMIFNWSIETVKWKYMIGKIEKIGFFKSMIAVFSGITVSIFTPNRVGEYAGRVFVLESASRWEGVFITVLGSMSQLLVTIIVGSVCFILYAYQYLDIFETLEFYGLVFIIAVLVFILLLFFFNVSLLSSFINRIPQRFQKFKQHCLVISTYKTHELLNILLLSLLRYFIFISQFYLLLNLFGADILYFDAFILISVVYLVMAAIPTFSLTELGVRGYVSVYFISMYYGYSSNSGLHDIGILTASSALWVINLAIPAIFGALFIFKLKFFR